MHDLELDAKTSERESEHLPCVGGFCSFIPFLPSVLSTQHFGILYSDVKTVNGGLSQLTVEENSLGPLLWLGIFFLDLVNSKLQI